MHDLSKIVLLTILTLASASLAAAPTGYSINSDSASGNADSLYLIDLATGVETRIGTVKSLGETRIDVEGLAFAPDGTLYGVDDDSMTLFPINPANGQVLTANEVELGNELPRSNPGTGGGGNDFGMTFACDGSLYISSVIKQTLYRLDLDGKLERIGSADGLLGANISALAAYGLPVQLYGLGNGMNGSLQKDSPRLHEIDLNTGIASPKSNEIGPNNYSEAGLAFDDAGGLWAITDRRQLNLPSQVMKIDLATGIASAIKAVNATGEQGFESLAITVPQGCGETDPEPVEITVSKEWVIPGEHPAIDESAVIKLHCENMSDGDGELQQDGSMLWRWNVSSGNSSHTATVYPASNGSTRCHTTENVLSSAVESVSDCARPVPILSGQGMRTCTIVNTLFFEGIPTLSQYGLLLTMILMLLTGLFAVRRI